MARIKVTRGSIWRYRVMAHVTGVGLLALCVSIYIQVVKHDDKPVEIFGTAHGYLYLLYLIVATDLAWRARWSLLKTVLVLLAGTIPFASFVAEHYATRGLVPAEPVKASA